MPCGTGNVKQYQVYKEITASHSTVLSCHVVSPIIKYPKTILAWVDGGIVFACVRVLETKPPFS